MMKEKIRDIRPYVALYRDTKTGLAWVENGTSGTGHSCHPNIDESGSVRGMIELGYWPRNARTVRSHGFIYHIDAVVTSDELDEIARENCGCGGKH